MTLLVLAMLLKRQLIPIYATNTAYVYAFAYLWKLTKPKSTTTSETSPTRMLTSSQ